MSEILKKLEEETIIKELLPKTISAKYIFHYLFRKENSRENKV